jgi:hypothetical protein
MLNRGSRPQGSPPEAKNYRANLPKTRKYSAPSSISNVGPSDYYARPGARNPPLCAWHINMHSYQRGFEIFDRF